MMGPINIKALEQLQLNDDLDTVVRSDNMCTRRAAMARATGLAAGLALAVVNQPGFAAQTKMIKMGSDTGQLVFQPDEVKLCEEGQTYSKTFDKPGTYEYYCEPHVGGGMK